MKHIFPHLRPSAMRESVAEALRDALLKGAFSPGELLSEVELASQMKVSRGPVREALLMLSLEGLLTHSQNRGYTVVQFTDREIVQNAQARLPSETLSLTLARARVSADDFRLLADLKSKIVSALSSGDKRGRARADLRFHLFIVEKTGNPWLEAAMKRILVPYFTFVMLEPQPEAGLTLDLISKQHELYIDYLSGKTSKSAEECVRFHFSRYSQLEQVAP